MLFNTSDTSVSFRPCALTGANFDMASTTKGALQDISVVYRLCFAARSLSSDSPNYWSLVSSFAVEGNGNYSLSPDEARIFIENMRVLHSDIFDTEETLTRSLIKLPKNGSNQPEKVGLVLVSSVQNCSNCHVRLYIRQDRAISAVIYYHKLGTIPAIHYTKYCRKRGCTYQQHYGYHSIGDGNGVIYDSNCLSLPYFMSSRESAFDMKVLNRFDVNILIGQISYRQATDIYNYYHGYDVQGSKDRYLLL